MKKRQTLVELKLNTDKTGYNLIINDELIESGDYSTLQTKVLDDIDIPDSAAYHEAQVDFTYIATVGKLRKERVTRETFLAVIDKKLKF